MELKKIQYIKIAARMKKLWNYIRYLVRTNKIWSRPGASKVLIYDPCYMNVLMKYIQQWDPEVMHIRGEQINMWILVASLFKKGRRKDAYVDSYIESVNPQLIITFIDNDLNFFTISQRHPYIKTLFIQNGWRSYYEDIFELLDNMDSEQLAKFSVDYMLSFGVVGGDHCARYITGSVIPMGSLKNNLMPIKYPTQLGIIAFISQWANSDGTNVGGEYCGFKEYMDQLHRPIILCLARYAKLKNKKLLIIPRKKKENKFRILEENYYSELLGCDADYLEPEGLFSSYNACDIAEVVVCIDSTLGYESIARGNKTAIFSIRSQLLDIHGSTYGWPGSYRDDGPFWTNNLNTGSFERILNYLFDVDDIQWKEDLKTTGFSSLMLYDPDNSILADTIEKEVGPSALSLVADDI